ncbi:MAG: UPF0146 family protein [Methanothrix sp.]
MSLLRGVDDLAAFIARNYFGRVVEVGAGCVSEVALGLKARGLDVVLTDKEERFLGSLRIEMDDIFSPRLWRCNWPAGPEACCRHPHPAPAG